MKQICKEIIKIERIQNETWYIQYSALRQEFTARLKEINEKHLYHGCPQESASKIIDSWFNRSFAGVNGRHSFLDHLFDLRQFHVRF